MSKNIELSPEEKGVAKMVDEDDECLTIRAILWELSKGRWDLEDAYEAALISLFRKGLIRIIPDGLSKALQEEDVATIEALGIWVDTLLEFNILSPFANCVVKPYG
jgi:hypothetical protein